MNTTSPDADLQQIRDRILSEALPSVMFDGWTRQTLAQATRLAGYDPTMAGAVFPGGVSDLVSHFADWADRQMLERLAAIDPESLRVRDRVATAVMERFHALAPWKDAVRQSATRSYLPGRATATARSVWHTADRIWIWAGDTATDWNRLSKRGLLSSILASVTLVWLQDQTPDLSTTRSVLDRKIENVVHFGRFIGRIKKAA